MIVEKHKPKEQDVEEPKDPVIPEGGEAEEVEGNPIIEVYKAVRRTLEALKENPNDPKSPPLFKTIKIDNGQFDRIVRNAMNEEYAVEFPAVFIRFINVRYLVAQQRLGEGRAIMRIRFILNNLNNSDDEVETQGFDVFQRINVALQDAKNYEKALNERTNLKYFDMPLSQDNGLQPFWIDYEIWFRDFSAFQYRNWVTRYLVIPPFTNHSDAPWHDTEGHGDHKEPSAEDAMGFSYSDLPFEIPRVLD